MNEKEKKNVGLLYCPTKKDPLSNRYIYIMCARENMGLNEQKMHHICITLYWGPSFFLSTDIISSGSGDCSW